MALSFVVAVGSSARHVAIGLTCSPSPQPIQGAQKPHAERNGAQRNEHRTGEYADPLWVELAAGTGYTSVKPDSDQ